jgi:Cu+-exporting ATPase
MTTRITKPFLFGLLWGSLAALALVAGYFAIVSLISGFAFAGSQFAQFWYYFGSLAVGFGIQIGLYVYLKQLVRDGGGKMVVVTGTTSAAAMVSCCAHYLVNILPVLGVSAFASFFGAYQVQLFWVGIAFNLVGIAYMISRVIKFKKYTT